MDKRKKNQISGITIISLVVTIIVLLILAGISVSMITGDNGIINKAGFAKEQTEIAKEKESIGTAAVHAINKSKFGDITQEKLQQQINNEFGEGKKAKVYEEDESFLVLVENRLYKVDKDGNVELSEENFELPKREFLAQLSNNELGVSADKPYEIKCIEDLLELSYRVNGITVGENGILTYTTSRSTFSGKYFKLKKNLNFKLPLSYEDSTRKDYGDVNSNGIVEDLLVELTTGNGWIPIGGNGKDNLGLLSGNFNGNNNSISNIYINNASEKVYMGFFGRINAGTIENINIKGNIYCNSTYTAGIIGFGNGVIKNCSFNGSIENVRENVRSYTAGIIANPSNIVTIEKCFNKGKLKGKFNVGGIIGSGKASVLECYNEGDLYSESTDSYSAIGGMAANGGNCDFYACYNSGKVEGPRNVGGITGGGARNVERCNNSGYIISKGSAGGINGGKTNGYTMNFVKCYNVGTIEGKNCAAGICAYNWVNGVSTFDQCYNLGEIKGENETAGITGLLQVEGSKLCNCYNSGKITGKKIAGVAWGNSDKIKIISCYNLGELEGTTKYGISYKGVIKNCYYLTNNGISTGNAVEVTNEELKGKYSLLDRTFTIDEETGEITISETEIQNVWKADTNNKNQGYPIFDWQ